MNSISIGGRLHLVRAAHTLRSLLLSKGPTGTGSIALITVVVALIKFWQHLYARRELNSYRGWLRMVSPLKGSTVKYLRPIWKYGVDKASWTGFCACCKRPIEISHSGRPPPQWPMDSARGKFAYVITLWGTSPAYALGALVLGFSIKRTNTPNSLICIHTADVPQGMIDLLSQIWDCRLVEHVVSSKALTSWKEPNRFDNVFTKLHCLSLVEFEKVLMMDIDLLVTSNIDDLFKLQAPAALRRGMNDGSWPLKHGSWIDGRMFFSGTSKGQASWGQATGINAGVMLLQPNHDVLTAMLEEITDHNHPSHCAGNGPEQDYLSRYWADAPWSQISPQYNFQLHQMFYALQPDVVWRAERNSLLSNPENIKVVHFSGEGIGKPWCRILGEDCHGWPDRSQDDAYILDVAKSFRGYWLWIAKDREWWDSLKHARDTDGIELGADGHLYRCPTYWESGNGKPVERSLIELPEWATQGAMNVLDWSLRRWFDACQELEASLGIDLREALKDMQKPPVAADIEST